MNLLKFLHQSKRYAYSWFYLNLQFVSGATTESKTNWTAFTARYRYNSIVVILTFSSVLEAYEDVHKRATEVLSTNLPECPAHAEMDSLIESIAGKLINIHTQEFVILLLHWYRRKYKAMFSIQDSESFTKRCTWCGTSTAKTRCQICIRLRDRLPAKLEIQDGKVKIKRKH